MTYVSEIIAARICAAGSTYTSHGCHGSEGKLMLLPLTTGVFRGTLRPLLLLMAQVIKVMALVSQMNILIISFSPRNIVE